MKTNTKSGKSVVSKTVKAGAKGSKAVKAAVEYASACKALKTGQNVVLLLTAGIESAFRRARYLGNGEFQCVQNNYGGSYDGAKITVTADDTLDGDFVGRLEFGNYICSKGGRAKVRVFTSEAAAAKACNLRVHGELRGVKTSVLCYGNEQAHYLACLDKTGRINGTTHAFQVETKRLKTNAIHFIAVSKFERLKTK